MQQIKIKIFMALLTFSTGVIAQVKKDGIISMQMSANDSMHVITATVTDANTKTPLKDVAIVFYLKRTFGLMKVGEEATTDTTGVASAEFPITTPGNDSSRTMIVIAKVEDNAVINDTSFQIFGKSKVAFPKDKGVPRSLMGAHAPWWLIISFWGALVTIYGLFIYIAILMYKIKKAAIHSLTVK
jgi:hypothetical protein